MIRRLCQKPTNIWTIMNATCYRFSKTRANHSEASLKLLGDIPVLFLESSGVMPRPFIPDITSRTELKSGQKSVLVKAGRINAFETYLYAVMSKRIFNSDGRPSSLPEDLKSSTRICQSATKRSISGSTLMPETSCHALSEPIASATHEDIPIDTRNFMSPRGFRFRNAQNMSSSAVSSDIGRPIL